MQKVSIYDLAKIANLSAMTVSRALRPGTPVSKATRRKIENLARQYNYKPNPVGVALKAGVSLDVAISYEVLTQSAFAPIIAELNLRLTKIGYYMRVLEPRPLALGLPDIKQLFLNYRPQGLMLMNLASGDVVSWLEEQGIPTVWLIERPRTKSKKVVFFGSEDYHGARLILDHLYQLGHRQIAHLSAQSITFGMAQRKRAYCDFMQERNLRPVIEPTTFDFKGGIESTLRLMTHRKRPTAIFCSNDHTAAGAMFHLQEMGLRIPRDISIVGFGDIPGTHYDYFYPGLTTVRHPYHQLALLAVDALVDMMLGKTITPGDCLLPAEIILRGTTGPGASNAEPLQTPRSHVRPPATDTPRKAAKISPENKKDK